MGLVTTKAVFIQTSLLSYRDLLEDQNFTCSKLRNDCFKNANNKGADKTARIRRLVCAIVVHKASKTGFLVCGPIYIYVYLPIIRIFDASK